MSNEDCGKQSPIHIVQNKKNTIQRQFYVCFCAKIYSSYSALYLHAKKKHGQNISMKNLKLKRHEWSGNVKNIYHQFVQQNLDIDGCQESQEAQLAPIYGDKPRDKGKQKQNDKEKYKDKGRQFLQKIIQKNKIQSLQNSGYKNNNNLPKQQKQLNNQKNNKFLQQLDTLFKKYISFSKAQNGTIEILHNFQNFMKSAYKNPPQHINLNININHSYNNYIHIHNNNNNNNSNININIQKDSFDFIPHCMNTFYSYNRQQNHHKNIYNHNLNYNYNHDDDDNDNDNDNEMCIKVLLKFADWLYCNAYTKYLTIEDKQYDKFINKNQ